MDGALATALAHFRDRPSVPHSLYPHRNSNPVMSGSTLSHHPWGVQNRWSWFRVDGWEDVRKYASKSLSEMVDLCKAMQGNFIF